MKPATLKEDVHFYCDNVPPEEAAHVLRVLSPDYELSPKQIKEVLFRDYGFEMQSDYTYSPRRLLDLGLSVQSRDSSKLTYRLNSRGVRLQDILGTDTILGYEIFHYLHYSGYSGDPRDRKYLWSYRRCCEMKWDMQKISNSEIAAALLSEMRERFPRLDYGAKTGARFKSTAVGHVFRWLRALEPSPFTDNDTLFPRTVERPELALLGLDDVYRNGGYTYGDPVLLDDDLIRRVAGVFFLDVDCTANLLRISARIKPTIRLSETLAGVSITLSKPISFEDL